MITNVALRSPWRAFGKVALLLLLVSLGVLRSHVGTRLDSFTVDEPWHIVAGTSYARSGDFHLNPEHPPLIKLWVGAAMPADFKLRAPAVLSEKAQEREWVEQTMFKDNDAAKAQRYSRAAMWSLNGLLIFILGLLLWRACGWTWAVGTLAFLAIEPTVGAHLPVVMTDLPLALTLMISVVAAGLLATTWQWRWVAVCGVAIGLALGAKHSALAGLAGLFAVLSCACVVGVYRRGDPTVDAPRSPAWRDVLLRGVKVSCVAALALTVLWALYGFHFHAAPDGIDAFNRAMPDKIAEVGSAVWRAAIAFADQWHLLPRAYLWGLADTVRTGLEGRGISEHFVWGTLYAGKAPWFAWPLIVFSKLPLSLSALGLLGAALLWRGNILGGARWILWILLGASACHLLALIGSGGVWGGIRHAMPLLTAASILAGAAVALAVQYRSRVFCTAVALLFVAAFAMTIREPRLWEYHNELAGGSENGYRYFGNEGLDLGQRYAEFRAFHDRVILPSGLPLYSNYWMMEEQLRAGKINFRRRVESLDDTNVEGRYDGYFVYTMSDTLPWASWDWDPREVFRDLTMVARFGYIAIWKGTQIRPETRASGVSGKVMDYIYKENGKDWALVARKLEEVVPLIPQQIDSGIELGNAYLRLGDGKRATQAYRRLLDQQRKPVDPQFRKQLEAHISLIETSTDPATLKPMRNPWLE